MDIFDSLFRHCRLYTFEDDSLGFVEDSVMAVKNGVIAWLGSEKDLPQSQVTDKTKIIDCKQQLLTPGLIDCHTHLVYGGNRAHEFEMRLSGSSYEQIHAQGGGIQSTVKSTREASFNHLFEQSLKRLKSMIAQGVTSVEIKSGYGLDLATEQKMLQVAKKLGEHAGVDVVKTFLGAHSLPKEFTEHAKYIDYIVDEMLPALVALDLVDAVDGFCENIAFSVEHIKKIFEAALKNNLVLKLHSDQLSNMGGTRLAAQYHALSVDHLEYANESDVKAIKASGTVAVLLPGAFYFLKETQKPPVTLLREHQVPMAVASDCNPGTSPTTSLLLMLNMACTLYGLTISEALLGVTKYAAQALDLKNRGILKVGFKADCVLWDIQHPRDLVYNFGCNPCSAVYKEGNRIYEHTF